MLVKFGNWTLRVVEDIAIIENSERTNKILLWLESNGWFEHTSTNGKKITIFSNGAIDKGGCLDGKN